MSDSRERFEAWCVKECGPGSIAKWLKTDAYENGRVQDYWIGWQAAWQAAEAETARRCAEIAGKLADEYRAKYKGVAVDGIRRGGTYDQHDDGMSDGAAVVEDAIRKEFPEAWK